jgi:energy-coupling factor transporter ATP-binding protein EcfA2
MKLNKIIKLSDAFATEVNVLRDYSYRSPEGNLEKVKGYLPNKSSRDILKSILQSCSESTDKKLHLVISSYGTGKSYLLLMLANILANNKVETSFIDKITDKENYYQDGLSAALDNHVNNSGRMLIVIPEYGDVDFDHALLEGLKFALKENKIEYVPKTNYEEAVKTISHWREKSPQNYEQLKEQIEGSTIEQFIEQLNSYQKSTYLKFKYIYQDINGSPFSDTHTSAFPIFSDTAKEIRKLGFRGISIIYDEFGEMLGKLINSSASATGLSIQQFIEDLKDKKDNSNILLISASHQDPNSLRLSKEKDLNKVIGRFERHQLTVSEAEGEEVMGSIFIKENPSEFARIFEHSLFKENLDTIEDFKLYPDKDSAWIKTKVLGNLYPLHPLTSYILPRLSAEFAQNTRSMFNFLSPTETKDGAFKIYLQSKNVYDENVKLNLFTPDLLLDFFLKNIREDKGGMVQTYYEAYREAYGKVTDDYQKSIIKNLFMLCVVKEPLIQASKKTLFWAMNWEISRRNEFSNLLDDLTETHELLELNPTNKLYQFPDIGAAPLSKIIYEEEKKLDNLSLSEAMVIWEEIHQQEDLILRDHNTQFGCNRSLRTVAVNDLDILIGRLRELEGFYNYKFDYFGSGLLFYLIGNSEDEIEELKDVIYKNINLDSYVVFATPNNIPQFERLIAETLRYKAIENTSKKPEVIQNPARLKNIEDQKQVVFGELETKIKNLYEPSNWKWFYNQEKNIDLSSKPKFSTWINQKITLLFSETPKIKDDALWFLEGNKGAKDRKQALDILLNADKDRIPLRDDNNSAADKRIIRNYFANIGLTSDKKREKNIQYGEIKMPDQDSQFYKAWKIIENKLKSGSHVKVIDIINPLIRAPFGLSENIIKFLLTSYIRYDIERITISDAKRKIVQTISIDLLDSLITKPEEFLIRKIEISGPELRYLNQLKTLFDKQDVNTWMDVTQKFIGVNQFLTPISKTIIKDSGNIFLQNFYESLDVLKAEFQINGSDKEKLSQQYFQETLPSILFNEGREFIEDDGKVVELIKKLDYFKKYPGEKESEIKTEIIRELAQKVFGNSIVTKNEITNVVSKWFRNLPAPNQSGKFENVIISSWLTEIKNNSNNDQIDLYLVKLNEKPFKDWIDISYEKFSLISRFQDYKKQVEEYTKSPVEVFQIIAREALDKSASECDSEVAFDNFMKKWWNSLPNIKQAEQYTPETNLLVSQILFPSSVKTRYLETIPQAWEKINYLPVHIASQWESWSNKDASSVGENYRKCIEEVIQWKPPVGENQVFNALGNLYINSNEIRDNVSLYTEIKKWFDLLPERTKKANWDKIDEKISRFIVALNEQSTFDSFIFEVSPSLFGLPLFKQWNELVLDSYIDAFTDLKKTLDKYKRPLFELVEIVEEKTLEKSFSEESFCFNLYNSIRESDAYKNKIDSTLINDTISLIIYEAAKKTVSDFNLHNIIPLISEELFIDRNSNLWTDKEQKTFTVSFKKGINNLVQWKFPEAEKLKKAKIKVRKEILLLQEELKLNATQMRKVLNDIIEEK